LSFSDAGQTTTGRVGVVGLQRGQRLDRLAEPLLVGQERPPRLQRVGDARALERPQSRPGRASTSSTGPSCARERRTSTIARSCSARQALEHVGGVRADLDPELRR
jgi:hypothetical protein